MQTKNKKKIAGILMLIFAGTLLSSFSYPWGGDSFEIYVNNKRVVQRYLTQSKPVQMLSWNQANNNDQVDIYYSHCGASGKDRRIIVRDTQNRTLKSWEFADATTDRNKAMRCKIKDILGAGKNGNTLYLYYSSRELPGGCLLAKISRG